MSSRAVAILGGGNFLNAIQAAMDRARELGGE